MKPSKKKLLLLRKIISQPYHDLASGQNLYHRFCSDERSLCMGMESQGLVRRMTPDAHTFLITSKGQQLFEEVMRI